jgi:hypothetical protein
MINGHSIEQKENLEKLKENTDKHPSDIKSDSVGPIQSS